MRLSTIYNSWFSYQWMSGDDDCFWILLDISIVSKVKGEEFLNFSLSSLRRAIIMNSFMKQTYFIDLSTKCLDSYVSNIFINRIIMKFGLVASCYGTSPIMQSANHHHEMVRWKRLFFQTSSFKNVFSNNYHRWGNSRREWLYPWSWPSSSLKRFFLLLSWMLFSRFLPLWVIYIPLARRLISVSARNGQFYDILFT